MAEVWLRRRPLFRFPQGVSLAAALAAAWLAAAAPAATPAARAAAGPAPLDSLKLDPGLRAALLSGRSDGAPVTRAHPAAGGALETGYDVFVRGPASAAQLAALGAEVSTDLGDIKTAWIPASALGGVLALPGVTRLEGSAPCQPLLDVSVPATGAAGLRGAGPAFTGLNGAGTMWGDVDTGIDWRHDDFKDAQGHTRIRYLWDQGGLAGSPPSGFAYGTEWTAATIDAGLCTESDLDGHGTHVTGIGAGDGSATGRGRPAFRYVGMAPAADIVMVSTTFSSTRIVDGVHYVFLRAAALGEPAVCNLSLGSQLGPHDGTSSFEQAISALAGTGKVVVVAAGNDGGSNLHADVLAAPGGTTVRLNIPSPSSASGQTVRLDGYSKAADNISVTVTTPNLTALGPVARGGNQSFTVAGQGNVYIANYSAAPVTGDHEIYIEIAANTTTVAAGSWDIRLTAVSLGADGAVDLWRYYETLPGTPAFTIGQTNRRLVAEPACALGVCSVGSWTTRQSWLSVDGSSYQFSGSVAPGNLSPFSSPGPTRDQRQKPDLAAPGSAIVSSLSSQANPSYPAALIDPDSVHVVMQGTSMAAPHISGAIALLQQNRGPLSAAQALALLDGNAVVDGFTGPVWNASWGWGKLLVSPAIPAVLEEVSVDASSGAVHLSWTVADDARVSDFQVERRLTGEADYAPLAVQVQAEPVSGGERYTLVDADVLPGQTYDYRLTGLDAEGRRVSFGPYVAVVPARALAWAFAGPAPNPARGSLQFRFVAGARGPAELEIVDLRGRLVARPQSGVVEAGAHVVPWDARAADGSRLARGVYLARFRGGGLELHRKFVLLE